MTLALCLIVPWITAILCWALRRHTTWCRTAAVVGSTLQLAAAAQLVWATNAAGFLSIQLSDWRAPFGISLVADLLSAAMVFITALIGLSSVIYSLASTDRTSEERGHHAVLQFLILGVSGAFLTGDLFNLYVWFEILLIASFVLLAIRNERSQLEAATKYVALNLCASAVFLTAAGLLYNATGTLNMADVALVLREQDGQLGLSHVVAMLMLAAFGAKAAIFPIYAWLPCAYHTPHHAVSAIFAGLLTKVGVYALIRIFTLIFTQDPAFTHEIIIALAAFTMASGVLAAAIQTDMRMILSFHIISQVGYMVWGLGMFTPVALAGAAFYLIHHIVVKANLFFVAGVVDRIGGTTQLKIVGGLATGRWWLALMFLIPALSLAGLPPLSGFWAKLILVREGLTIGAYASTIVALGTGFLTLYSMIKIWGEVFWKEAPKDAMPQRKLSSAEALSLLGPIAVLCLWTVAMGLAGEPVMQYALRTSEQLMNPELYIAAILGQGVQP